MQGCAQPLSLGGDFGPQGWRGSPCSGPPERDAWGKPQGRGSLLTSAGLGDQVRNGEATREISDSRSQGRGSWLGEDRVKRSQKHLSPQSAWGDGSATASALAFLVNLEYSIPFSTPRYRHMHTYVFANTHAVTQNRGLCRSPGLSAHVLSPSTGSHLGEQPSLLGPVNHSCRRSGNALARDPSCSPGSRVL